MNAPPARWSKLFHPRGLFVTLSGEAYDIVTHRDDVWDYRAPEPEALYSLYRAPDRYVFPFDWAFTTCRHETGITERMESLIEIKR